MLQGQRKKVHGEDMEETRQMILRVAEQLFMEYGYRAVSTRQLADVCGFTQPALYHYFADKQQLYVEVMRENIARKKANLEYIRQNNECIEEQLRLVVHYLLENTHHDIGLMIRDIQHEIDVQRQNELKMLFQQDFITPIAAIFEDGIRQGFLLGPKEGGVDAELAAYLFMSMLTRFFASSPCYFSPTREISEDVQTNDVTRAEVIVQILLRGLVKHNNGNIRRI